MKKTIKKGLLLIASVLAAGAVMAGCSNNDQAADGTTTASDNAAQESTTSNNAANNVATDGVPADVQKIIDAKVLNVGVKIDVPKFGLQNTSTGEYEGFEIDLAYRIAGEIFGCTAEEAKTNNLINFQGVTAKTRGPLVDNGELDLVIATYTITPERKENWNFSSPYYTDAVGLMVLKESGFSSIEDLDGKIIGVSQGSNTKDGFNTYIEAQGLDITPIFEEFDGYPSLSTALAAKNIDVFAVDRAILAGYNNDSTVILDDRFAEQEYGVVSKKENTGLADLVEGVVTDLLDSGEMANMLTEWGIE